jgi:group I intron endonuclease
MFVYKVLNKLNGKVYIGQTNRPIEERWKEHCKPALRGRSYLSAAIQKYGKDHFDIEILEKANSQEELDKLEFDLINSNGAMFPNGYNLREGGRGGTLSEEAKDKVRKANIGKIKSEETRKKLSKASKGHVAHYSRPVIGISIETGEIIEMTHADAMPERFHYNCVHRCAKGERKKHKGFTWKYK